MAQSTSIMTTRQAGLSRGPGILHFTNRAETIQEVNESIPFSIWFPRCGFFYDISDKDDDNNNDDNNDNDNDVMAKINGDPNFIY